MAINMSKLIKLLFLESSNLLKSWSDNAQSGRALLRYLWLISFKDVAMYPIAVELKKSSVNKNNFTTLQSGSETAG